VLADNSFVSNVRVPQALRFIYQLGKMHMHFGKSVMAAVLAAAFALPAAAQTSQMTPAKPSTSIPAKPALSQIAPAPRASSTTSSALVDINSASPTELDALPGIGKARADAIIKNRPYKGKDDLTNRRIIPPNVYDGIKDKIIARQG
jgi:competence protein ComEA